MSSQSQGSSANSIALTVSSAAFITPKRVDPAIRGFPFLENRFQARPRQGLSPTILVGLGLGLVEDLTFFHFFLIGAGNPNLYGVKFG